MTVLSATDAALRAFEARPTRAEAMADLTRYFHEAGMRETAALFAQRGLAAVSEGDLLFIEDVRHELASALSIDGYYSVDPETRRKAAVVCDALTLDRNASPEVRVMARHNLHFYLRHISLEFPSWRARRLTFSPPLHYNQMAPSVCLHGGRLLAAQRCVNYAIDLRRYYRISDNVTIDDGADVHTRTLLLELDPDTLVDIVRGEIITPLEPVPGSCRIHGFEDMRMFSWRGELWGLSAVLDQNTDGHVEQWLGRIQSNLVMTDLRPINPKPISPRDKNWMPVVDGDAPLRFIYWTDPGRIIGVDGETIMSNVPHLAADHLRGSSPAIPFDGGWLTVVHWLEWFDGWPKYRHRFAWYDHDLTLKKVSPGWVFSDKTPEIDVLKGYEYCTGLCWHPEINRLVIGYQIHEREGWVGTIDSDEVALALSSYFPDAPPRGSLTVSPAPSDGQTLRWDDVDLDRSASPESRERARREMLDHLKSPTELFPSWRDRPLDAIPPVGYAAMTPSVINFNGRLFVTMRGMNYRVGDEGGLYRITDGAPIGADVEIASVAFLVELDASDMVDHTLGLLTMQRSLVKPRGGVAVAYGFEDLKPFTWGRDLWAIAAFAEQSANGQPEQWLVRIDLDTMQLSDARAIRPQWSEPGRCEKNWMPIIGQPEPRFVYWCDPTMIVDAWGNLVAQRESPIAAEHFHGASQAIPFDGGWLAVVRWRQVLDDKNLWVDFKYRNRFIWFDFDFNLKRISPAWEFPIDDSVPSFPQRFQLVHGLCWHPDGKRLVMSYVMYEREPHVATTDADDVRKVLETYEVKLDPNEDEWVMGQTNRALLCDADIEHAVSALNRAGLPRYNGPRKDWDSYLAIHHCMLTTRSDQTVLDAGGTRGSSFLRALRALNYTRLINIDLGEANPGTEDGITYLRGDITDTGLPDNSLQFVLCQSVLEHNVDWRAFFREMGRVVGVGGDLFVSVDYWNKPIISNITIFTPDDIAAMIDCAATFGFECQGDMNYECKDSWPWAGYNYTFINFLLKKRS